LRRRIRLTEITLPIFGNSALGSLSTHLKSISSAGTTQFSASTHQYQLIDMASAAKETLPINTSDIPLDAIEIKPGKFFLNADNRLCYYQQDHCSRQDRGSDFVVGE
jgi:hypothetical protein